MIQVVSEAINEYEPKFYRYELRSSRIVYLGYKMGNQFTRMAKYYQYKRLLREGLFNLQRSLKIK
jgi:hypothetical protein